MITILISYDLRGKNKDYNILFEEIKKADGWWHHLESTWIIETNSTLNYWVDRIRSVIDQNDSFIAIEISNGKANGLLPREAWNCISETNGMR
jgi:hypothetical protein